jgi:hypothetical protein
VGQLLNGFEVRVPHPCALCKGAVLEVSPGTFQLRALFRNLPQKRPKRQHARNGATLFRNRSSELQPL